MKENIYRSCKKIFSNIIFLFYQQYWEIHWNFKFFFKTSSTVASTLYQLALHPDEQDRAYNEVCSILPDKDVQLDGKHLDKLKYLKACIKETLRFVLKFLIFYFYPIFILRIILLRNLLKSILLVDLKIINFFISIYLSWII